MSGKSALSRFEWYRAVLALVALTVACWATVPAAAEEASQIEQRLSESVRYLASDELEGRGLGTEGLNKAADYIAQEFQRIGLKTDLVDGGPFQKFTTTIDVRLGAEEDNRLVFHGPPNDSGEPQRIELKLGEQFNTLALGSTGEANAPLVFAGYGITAPDEQYDDYANVEVEGKVVLILRKEPQQNNPHSAFNGTQDSSHAWFTRKIANAYEHGAAAVILINNHYELQQKVRETEKQWSDTVDRLVQLRREFLAQEQPDAEAHARHRQEIGTLVEQLGTLAQQLESGADEVLAFDSAGVSSDSRRMPVFFCSRKVVEPIVQAATGTSLAELERQIDEQFVPQSRELGDWKVECESHVVQKLAEVKNVLGVLEGSGPFADEIVIVGAHYDHLGHGGSGSLAPWTTEIHNGADDNASGTAALIEVARRFAQSPPASRRTLVFIAFTAEERGLLGSAEYVRDPLYPLEKTVAMINMDMVGRLQDNQLIVHGTGTAAHFEGLVDKLNEEANFEITKKPEGFGPSDHASFYARQIPVLHLFTGTHNDYHRPSDDYDKVNVPGMRRVVDYVGDLAEAIATADSRPEYREIQRPRMAEGGDRPYLGSIPDFAQNVEGYALMGVTPGGPAEKAGLKAGDVIVQFGESRIGGLEDIDSALRKYKAGDQVEVRFRRGNEEQTVTVTLEAPR